MSAAGFSNTICFVSPSPGSLFYFLSYITTTLPCIFASAQIALLLLYTFHFDTVGLPDIYSGLLGLSSS